MAEFKDVTTYAGLEPISLQEAKDYLRVSNSDDDNYLTSLISTAREIIEKDTNASIVSRSYSEYFDGFLSKSIELQVSGGLEYLLTTIQYKSTSATTFDGLLIENTDFYTSSFQGRPKVISINGWPATFVKEASVKVNYTVGPINATPKALIQAMYLLISHYYDNRSPVAFGTVKELPLGYKKLIAPYKNYIF